MAKKACKAFKDVSRKAIMVKSSLETIEYLKKTVRGAKYAVGIRARQVHFGYCMLETDPRAVFTTKKAAQKEANWHNSRLPSNNYPKVKVYSFAYLYKFAMAGGSIGVMLYEE